MVDRKKTIESLENIADAIVNGYIREPGEACNAIADALELLKKQETKQGHWNLLDESKGWFECSECGDIACCAGNFCQACGARMDGEVG